MVRDAGAVLDELVHHREIRSAEHAREIARGVARGDEVQIGEECGIDRDDTSDDPERLIVWFISERVPASRADVLAELERIIKKDPLDALAAKAETNAARRSARRAVAAAPIARAQRAAMSPLGFLTGFGAHFVVAMVVLFGALMVQTHTLRTIACVCFALGAVLGVLIFTAHVSVRRAVARENVWLDALPFAVVDHLKMFGFASGTFTIHFAAEKPDPAAFTKALGGVSLPMGFILRNDSKPFEVEVRDLEVGATCRARWSAWRSVVSTLLVPLHGRYPIERVTCS